MGILVIVGLAICFVALPIILTQHNSPAQPAASRATTTEEPEQLDPNVIKVSIAGINFRDNIGDYVGRFNAQLVPEPTNKYDPDAIAILHTDGHLLGLFPRATPSHSILSSPTASPTPAPAKSSKSLTTSMASSIFASHKFPHLIKQAL